jgi:FAD/FMN-containing dehydrogenase
VHQAHERAHHLGAEEAGAALLAGFVWMLNDLQREGLWALILAFAVALIAGSLGTLGVIAEATLKVLPQPVAETTLEFACDEAEAVRRLNTWGGQPLPVSASFWHEQRLWLRLSGAAAAVDAAWRALETSDLPAQHAAAEVLRALALADEAAEAEIGRAHV